MKYFKVRFGVSSGWSQWQFIALPNGSDKDDARDILLEENRWVYSAETFVSESEEITEEWYKHGKCAENYFERNPKLLKENVFPVKEWAVLFANPKKPVRIGYPNWHQVYRMNDNRELSYQYDYNAGKFGILKCFERAYPV